MVDMCALLPPLRVRGAVGACTLHGGNLLGSIFSGMAHLTHTFESSWLPWGHGR